MHRGTEKQFTFISEQKQKLEEMWSTKRKNTNKRSTNSQPLSVKGYQIIINKMMKCYPVLDTCKSLGLATQGDTSETLGPSIQPGSRPRNSNIKKWRSDIIYGPLYLP